MNNRQCPDFHYSNLRIPSRYAPVVFAFFMSTIMAMLMCIVIVGANSGISTGYVSRVLLAYKLAMPVAFICVMAVRPVVMKLVAISVRP
ncbi:DUF2798 domain-containing protein [Methylobacillus caricis]|uniref:DUF2798 domain-containing protein n=1 Tax=Methylobacillus caricis TaxID=1971611 RepID=UPI001CFF8C83|nr:DUF2798 domain-containing protein [Methylobacillus caricis]MCB5189055.1 DUF2798 domain-containing protein [Methylobacillus caricis]